ncbi:hypothetical protein EVAR_51786_1 [Eumeta japonica]|uniref:Uncharacterized protein n=1 Tax=Eumeta variegata TaxID=151549 RepID=A0A4C1XFD4_EUMVA|nr:hypothetical protein EVAR_51786_1 [Eumeta japonica]
MENAIAIEPRERNIDGNQEIEMKLENGIRIRNENEIVNESETGIRIENGLGAESVQLPQNHILRSAARATRNGGLGAYAHFRRSNSRRCNEQFALEIL